MELLGPIAVPLVVSSIALPSGGGSESAAIMAHFRLCATHRQALPRTSRTPLERAARLGLAHWPAPLWQMAQRLSLSLSARSSQLPTHQTNISNRNLARRPPLRSTDHESLTRRRQQNCLPLMQLSSHVHWLAGQLSRTANSQSMSMSCFPSSPAAPPRQQGEFLPIAKGPAHWARVPPPACCFVARTRNMAALSEPQTGGEPQTSELVLLSSQLPSNNLEALQSGALYVQSHRSKTTRAILAPVTCFNWLAQ